MSETLSTSIPRKLGFRPGMVCVIIDAPAGMAHGLPVSAAAEPDLVLAFAVDNFSLRRALLRALKLDVGGALLWFALPVVHGPAPGQGWEELEEAGFLPSTQVVLDANWMARRFLLPGNKPARSEMHEIIDRVRDWAGGEGQAMAWYRSQPIPALNGLTAEALVRDGQADAVRRYLDHVALGGFA